MRARARQLAYEQAQLLADVLQSGYTPLDADDSAVTRSALLHEFSAVGAAMVLGWAQRFAVSQLELADDLLNRLPQVYAALTAGRIDLAKARAFAHALCALSGLSVDQAREVAGKLLPKAGEWTLPQLRDRLRYQVGKLTPQETDERYHESIQDRRVWRQQNDDGTASLGGENLPVDQAAAAYERVDAIARAAKAAGDRRTLAQLRADAYLSLLANTEFITQPTIQSTTEDTSGYEGSSDGGEGRPASDIATPTAADLYELRQQRPLAPDEPMGVGFIGDNLDATEQDRALDGVLTPVMSGIVGRDPVMPSTVVRDPVMPSTVVRDPVVPSAVVRDPVVPSAVVRNSATPSTVVPSAVVRDPATPTEGGALGGSTSHSAGLPASPPSSQLVGPPSSQPLGRPVNVASRRGVVDLQIDLDTLLELNDNPALVPGWGPVIADIARQIALDQETNPMWRFSVIDGRGRLLHHGHTSRRPTATEKAFVIARDKRCQFPGCNRPGRLCDLDHCVPYSERGPSHRENLVLLCRFHHRLKHLYGFIPYLVDGAIHVWIKPNGRLFQVTPDGDRMLTDADPDPPMPPGLIDQYLPPAEQDLQEGTAFAEWLNDAMGSRVRWLA